MRPSIKLESLYFREAFLLQRVPELNQHRLPAKIRFVNTPKPYRPDQESQKHIRKLLETLLQKHTGSVKLQILSDPVLGPKEMQEWGTRRITIPGPTHPKIGSTRITVRGVGRVIETPNGIVYILPPSSVPFRDTIGLPEETHFFRTTFFEVSKDGSQRRLQLTSKSSHEPTGAYSLNRRDKSVKTLKSILKEEGCPEFLVFPIPLAIFDYENSEMGGFVTLEPLEAISASRILENPRVLSSPLPNLLLLLENLFEARSRALFFLNSRGWRHGQFHFGNTLFFSRNEKLAILVTDFETSQRITEIVNDFLPPRIGKDAREEIEGFLKRYNSLLEFSTLFLFHLGFILRVAKERTEDIGNVYSRITPILYNSTARAYWDPYIRTKQDENRVKQVWEEAWREIEKELKTLKSTDVYQEDPLRAVLFSDAISTSINDLAVQIAIALRFLKESDWEYFNLWQKNRGLIIDTKKGKFLR